MKIGDLIYKKDIKKLGYPIQQEIKTEDLI